MEKEKEYIPYGPEWKKELKEFNKDGLIELLEKALRENETLRRARNEGN